MAKDTAHAIQVAMETCSTENDGTYTDCKKATLLKKEPSLNSAPSFHRGNHRKRGGLQNRRHCRHARRQVRNQTARGGRIGIPMFAQSDRWLPRQHELAGWLVAKFLPPAKSGFPGCHRRICASDSPRAALAAKTRQMEQELGERSEGIGISRRATRADPVGAGAQVPGKPPRRPLRDGQLTGQRRAARE